MFEWLSHGVERGIEREIERERERGGGGRREKVNI